MTDASGSELADEFLIEQYSALRKEINTRIMMRRRLIAAGLAFTAAFLSFVFTGNPENRWLLSILPLVVAFLMIEVYRSEHMIKRAALFIQEFEQDLDIDHESHGWESTHGGYAPREGKVPKSGINTLVLIVMTAVYLVTVVLAVIFWENPPTQLDFLCPATLVVIYLLALIVVGFFVHRVRSLESPKPPNSKRTD